MATGRTALSAFFPIGYRPSARIAHVAGDRPGREETARLLRGAGSPPTHVGVECAESGYSPRRPKIPPTPRGRRRIRVLSIQAAKTPSPKRK